MIFVTGGTGLLGSHLLFYLIKSNSSLPIRATYRSKHKIKEVEFLFKYLNKIESTELSPSVIEWVQCDLLNFNELSKLMVGTVNVFHCAAKVSFYRSDFNACMKQNVVVTRNIVNICLELSVEKLCYVSSTAAIGDNKDGITNEKFKWTLNKSTSGYSISKYKAELEVWRGINEGLKAIVINPCVILGAGNWNSSSLSIFKTLSDGLKYYPPGSNAIVDARDVACCLIKMMNSTVHAEKFLCVGHNIKYQELFDNISDQLHVKKPNIKVSFGVAKLVAQFIEILQFYKSNKSGISKEMVQTSYRTITYDNSKIRKFLDIEFKPFEDTINYCINGRYKVD